MSSFFSDLIEDIERGRRGENYGISVEGSGLDKLGELLGGIQSARYDVIGGGTGTGKTSLVDLMYVVAPLLYLFFNPSVDIDYKIIYNSLEISRRKKIVRIACLLLYILEKIVIDWKEMLSYNSTGEVLADVKYNRVLELKQIIEFIESKMIILDGFVNPTRIKMTVEDYASTIGHFKHRKEGVGTMWKDGKVPNDSKGHRSKGYIEEFVMDKRIVVQVITDHIGLLSPEHEIAGSTNLLTGKKLIDRHSKYGVYYRDKFGFSVVDISQFNRELSDFNRRKFEVLMPQLEDFKDSGNPGENADTVLALLNPERYNIPVYKDYDTQLMPKMFRALYVLKNRNGTDMHFSAMRFIGQCGHFAELPSDPKYLKVNRLYPKITDTNNVTLNDI